MSATRGERGEAPDVSVVVATHGRPDTLVRTLDSLAAQTLAAERFEVVVVPNGPAAGTSETVAVLRAYAATHPGLRLRTVVTDVGGAAHARSVGVAAARGTWMTMVDDDDWVSPAYLQRLLDAARPGVVPVVDVADVVDGGEPSLDNEYAAAFARFRGRTVPIAILPKAMSFNVCKLLPTRTAREVGFDEGLRSGSDTLFWLRVAQRTRALLHVVDVDDAVYYRTTETGSLSRQDASYDFSVTRRLEAYAALATIPDNDGETSAVLLHRTRSGTLGRHVNGYLRDHPAEHARVLADVRERGLDNVAWPRAVRGLAAEAVVVGDLTAPAASATTARRVAARCEVVDLVGTVAWADQRAVVAPFAAPYVAPSEVVVGPDADPWRRAAALAEALDGLAAADRAVPLTAVRSSHAEWGDPGEPVAHLAAAAFAARTGATWTAEVPALPRDLEAGEPGTPPPVLRDLVPAGAGPGAAGWSLVFERADRIVFPSAALREAVLARAADHPAAARAAEVSVVEPVPAVPAWDVAHAAVPAVPAVPADSRTGGVVLGWVPDGPVDPLLDLLGRAVLGLPPASRERVRVLVAAADPAAVRAAARTAGVGDLVDVAAPLPPAAEVARQRAADVWVVTDAADPLVPPAYLPDVLESAAGAWVLRGPETATAGALAEVEGRWSGRVDDVAAATEVLRHLVDQQPGA